MSDKLNLEEKEEKKDKVNGDGEGNSEAIDNIEEVDKEVTDNIDCEENRVENDGGLSGKKNMKKIALMCCAGLTVGFAGLILFGEPLAVKKEKETPNIILSTDVKKGKLENEGKGNVPSRKVGMATPAEVSAESSREVTIPIKNRGNMVSVPTITFEGEKIFTGPKLQPNQSTNLVVDFGKLKKGMYDYVITLEEQETKKGKPIGLSLDCKLKIKK